MKRLTEIFKLYGLTTTNRIDHSMRYTFSDRECLIKAYNAGLNVRSSQNYASLTCNSNCSHWIYKHEKGFAYSWSGSHYLVAKDPLQIATLHELNELKEKELKEARQRRFHTIKSPRDAVRVTFKDLKIDCSMVGGVPRINCGPFEIEFGTSKDDSPKVEVTMVYRGYYVNRIPLVTLTVADPEFNKKAEAIVFNGKNLAKLLLGKLQPKSLD